MRDFRLPPWEVSENCNLLGYYAASSGNFLSTFRHNLSAQSSGFKNPMKNNPEERSSHWTQMCVSSAVRNRNQTIPWRRVLAKILLPSLIFNSESSLPLLNYYKYSLVHSNYEGTRWQWAPIRKVAGSIQDGIIGIFHWHNPSGRIMALGEMSTRNISWGVKAAGA